MSPGPANKQEQISARLRQEIIARVFPPGSQLPTRAELEERFKASRMTIQKALDELAESGFIYAQGRHGTFVSERLPHQARYGIIFPHRPGAGAWPRFWTALYNEAHARGAGTADGSSEGNGEARRFAIFYGPEYLHDESYRELLDELKAQRLAGLIFASHPGNMQGTPLLSPMGLPRVAVMGRFEFGLPAVYVDHFAFLDRALDYFREKNRKRVAVLLGLQQEDYRQYFLKGLAARGLETRPYWMQCVSPRHAESARGCVHLLLHEGQRERPNGLLITDDNLVEHASIGLVASGMQVPKDLEVIAHCNFPWPPPSALPVQRLGFDTRRILSACVNALDAQARGEKLEALVLIPPQFESEVPAVPHGLSAAHMEELETP